MIFKKPILSLIFLAAIFLPAVAVFADEPTGPAKLELDYPGIGGLTEESLKKGLPEYAQYIFYASIFVLGFVIFSVIVYNGVRYLTSSGDPTKMTSAREGIFSAFIGAIVLLASVFVFNTINPQLVIFELNPVPSAEQFLGPGVYVCNFKVGNDFRALLKQYLDPKGFVSTAAAAGVPVSGLSSEPENVRSKAAAELIKIMSGKDQYCYNINTSKSFGNMVVENRKNTIFILPFIDEEKDATGKETGKRIWSFKHGFILHEKDKMKGRCSLTDWTGWNNDPKWTDKIYFTSKDIASEMVIFEPVLDFTALSITIFQEPAEEPIPEKLGVTLYECFDRNRTPQGNCPEWVTGAPKSADFRPQPGKDITKIGQAGLDANLQRKVKDQVTGDIIRTERAVRSVGIDPEGSYFGLLFAGDKTVADDDFKGNCEVINNNETSLFSKPQLKDCPSRFWNVGSLWNYSEWEMKECKILLDSMEVVKGFVL